MLEKALAGALSSQPAARQRTALIIGNVGKLGEELLNVLLERRQYGRVAVGVRKAMRTVVAKLEPLPMPLGRTAWDPAAALRWVPDDLYLCLEPARASFWKLARPYVGIASEEAVAIARRMRAAGTRRLAVITPLEAMLQLGLGSTIRNVDEMALVEAGFERLVILRPSAQEQAASGGGFFRAVGGLVLRTLGSVMTPKRLQPVKVRRAAQIAVDALAEPGEGVRVIGAADLQAIAGDPLEGA